MKTHFKIVVLDETQYWCDRIKAKAGKIYAAYFFDANRPVHCCELRPSYELHPLYSTPLIDDSEGRVSEEIIAGDSSEPHYFHCSSIDRLPSEFFYDTGHETYSAGESWEEILSEKIDYYRGVFEGVSYLGGTTTFNLVTKEKYPWFDSLRDAVEYLEQASFAGYIQTFVTEPDGSGPSWITAGVFYRKESGMRSL